MKKITSILLIAVLLSLTACHAAGEAEPVAPVEPVTETQPAEETPDAAPPEEEPAAPELPDTPEDPVLPEPDLWDGQPVYVYNSYDSKSAALALDPAGQVILEQEGAVFSLLRDSVTGEIRGILAAGILNSGSATVSSTAWNRLYDCQGQLLCEGFSASSPSCAGSVFWYYEDLSSITIRRLADGEILWEDLSSVTVLGQNLYVEQQYWNAPAMILSQEGELVAELDRGFSAADAAYNTPEEDYQIIEARDGTQSLIGQDGTPRLDRFYDQVTGVSEGCALVRSGESYLAIDLATGEAVFQWSEPILELLPDGAVVTGGGSRYLVDRQGKALCTQAFEDLQVQREDGEAVFLCGQYTANDGTTWAVFLEPDGAERFRVEVGFGGLTALSSRWAVYDTGAEPAASPNRVYAVANLATGESTQLSRRYSSVAPFWSGAVTDGMTEGCFWAAYAENGRTLWDVLTPDGQVVLSGLTDCSYVGGGVFDCRQGDAQGLLRLDGKWLYRAE